MRGLLRHAGGIDKSLKFAFVNGLVRRTNDATCPLMDWTHAVSHCSGRPKLAICILPKSRFREPDDAKTPQFAEEPHDFTVLNRKSLSKVTFEASTSGRNLDSVRRGGHGIETSNQKVFDAIENDAFNFASRSALGKS